MIGKNSRCYCTSARLGTVRTFAAAIAAVAMLGFAVTAQAQTDDCNAPTVVTDGATPINLTGATSTGLPACGDFPSGTDFVHNDLFVSYTATCDGTLFIDTCGNSFDARLAVYGANVDCTAINGGTLPVECNDDHGNTTEADTGMTCPNSLSASLSIPVNSGDVHIIRVGSFSATAQTASFNLNIACLAGGSGACCLPAGGCTDVTNGTTECDGLGGTYQGDFTTCATAGCPEACTTCLTPINSYPYSEDFEAGFGLWTQSANDDFDWTRDSGGTGSTGTGPSVDHTLGTAAGFYLYTEATGPVAGDRFILDGPCFDLSTLTDPAFFFWYHMWSTNASPTAMGTLDVEISTDNCLTYTNLFSISGNQGDIWLFQQIDLSAYAGMQVNIRFVGTRGTDFTSDIAIDDIAVGEGAVITGACCALDGSCTEEEEATCLGNGGTYRGNLTSCMDVDCTGACCLANNTCAVASEASCGNAGGTYAGDGTVCFSYDINTGTSNGGIICEGSCSDLTILRANPAQTADIDILFNNDVATADEASGSCGGSAANGNLNNDALFRYFAGTTGPTPCDVTITVTPTGYDAVLIVGSGCASAELDCSDSGGTGGVETVTLLNQLGPIYIQVGDFGLTEGGGLTQLQITCSNVTGACCQTDGSCAELTDAGCATAGGTYQGDGSTCTPNPCPQPPANDDCAGAIEITIGTVNLGNNCLASTTDDAEVSCQANSNKDVWFVWTATCTGEVTMDTEGSVFAPTNDTVLAVFDSCGGTEIACDDDDGTGLLSLLTFNAVSGTDYYIRIAGFNASCGDIQLNIACSVVCGSCPGDVNGDSLLDGLDIQQFTNCYLADAGGSPSEPCACADVNEDSVIDDLDIPAFVALILNGGVCNPGACCYLDGGSAACAVTTADGCATLGGNFTLGADCTGDPCPAGRCCSNGGLTCNDIPEVECAALGGNWDGGLDCIGSPCPITPANDDCGGAIAIFDGSTPIDLTNATHSGILACGNFPVGNDEVNNDLWYSYVASCDGTLFVDTCGNTFDARLAIYDVDCAAIIGGTLPVDCNDDHADGDGNSCTETLAASFSTPVVSGNTYIVRVGSFSTTASTGMFNLNINCVSGGSGACCLANGSCVDVTMGDVECSGLGGTYGGDGSSCATTICGGACCLANGTCVDALTGSDCVDNIGGIYQGNGTECASTMCPQPPPSNDECANALVVATGTTVGVNNCGAIAPDDREASCRTASERDVYYSWTADCTGDATIDTIGSVLTNNDTVLSVYETSCGGPELACDDDIGFPNFLSEVTLPVTSGTTYIIRVAGWDSDECGDIVLNIACNPAGFGSCCLGDGSCVDVTNGDIECSGLGGTYNGDGTNCATTICGGACCLANGSCVDALTGSDCVDNLGGIYEGNGTECASTQCPQPLPANDMCADAEAMSIGATVSGYTISANPETLGTCGTSDGTGGAVWYSVIGDGTTLTATTCNPGTDFDTKLRVFTDGCATLTCVGGNDDQAGTFDVACDSTGTGFNRASTFSWCSTPGVEYLILVHGFSTAEGNYEMTVTSDLTPCP